MQEMWLLPELGLPGQTIPTAAQVQVLRDHQLIIVLVRQVRRLHPVRLDPLGPQPPSPQTHQDPVRPVSQLIPVQQTRLDLHLPIPTRPGPQPPAPGQIPQRIDLAHRRVVVTLLQLALARRLLQPQPEDRVHVLRCGDALPGQYGEQPASGHPGGLVPGGSAIGGG